MYSRGRPRWFRAFAHGVPILLLAVVVGATTAAAQESAFRLVLTRPDAQLEELRGRLLSEPPSPPAADASIHSCGSSVEISLRKLQYSETAGFRYYFIVRRSRASDWEEWLVTRPDRGQFTPQLVEGIKVFTTTAREPTCQDFQLPLYCLSSCAQTPWWTLSGDAPKELTIYLSAGGYWNLLFTKVIPLPARISEPTLSILDTGEDSWRISVEVVPQSTAQDGQVTLGITPRWNRLQSLLWNRKDLKARLTYRSVATDQIIEGVTVGANENFSVVLKPDPWLLPIALLVGLGFAFLIRRLAWNDIRRPLREFGLVTLVGLVFLFLGYITGTGVEVASAKLGADGLGGAGIIGFTTGLSGRAAVKRLNRLLGLKEEE